MSKSLIAELQQKVSFIVLDGETENLHAKTQALSDFYPILLSAINAKPELFDELQDELNPDILTIFAGNHAIKKQVLDFIGGDAPKDEIESVLNRSIAPTLNFLVNTAGTTNFNTIQHFLKMQMPLILNALPQWASELLESIGIKNSIADIRQTLPRQNNYRKAQKNKTFIFPIVALVIIVILLAVILYSIFNMPNLENNTNHQAEYPIETKDEIIVEQKKDLVPPVPEVKETVQVEQKVEQVEQKTAQVPMNEEQTAVVPTPVPSSEIQN